MADCMHQLLYLLRVPRRAARQLAAPSPKATLWMHMMEVDGPFPVKFCIVPHHSGSNHVMVLHRFSSYNSA